MPGIQSMYKPSESLTTPQLQDESLDRRMNAESNGLPNFGGNNHREESKQASNGTIVNPQTIVEGRHIFQNPSIKSGRDQLKPSQSPIRN